VAAARALAQPARQPQPVELTLERLTPVEARPRAAPLIQRPALRPPVLQQASCQLAGPDQLPEPERPPDRPERTATAVASTPQCRPARGTPQVSI